MSFLAGDVYAVLGARVDPAGFAAYDAAMNKATASAARAEKAQAGAAASAAKASTASGKAAQSATALGAASRAGRTSVLALAGGLAASVASASRFQKQMAELQAVTGASGKQMAEFAKIAKDLGAKTGVGASAAAEALTELAKGGLSVKDIMGGAFVGTLNLAQAGAMQLADAGQAVVKTLSQFQLSGSQATHVADALASAANATSMDVGDFTQALAQGGAAAAAAGLSFDDTINIMSSMANRFQSGSDMGTSLKTTLTQLAHPSKQAADELRRLGLDAFDSSGKIKNAADLTKLLGDKFQEMTPKQRLASAAIIAGTDGMRTLIALSQGAAQNVIRNGSAAEVAAKKTDNLAGAWNRFKASVQNVAIDLGGPLLGPLADGLEVLRNNMSAALVSVAAFAGVSGIGKLVGAFQALRTAGAGSALTGLMAALRANPWTAAATGAAALGFALVKMAGQEDAAAQSARRHAAAMRELKAAMDEVAGKERDDAQAQLNARVARQNATDAHREYNRAVREFGKNSREAQQAELRWNQAVLQSTQATLDAGDATEQRREAIRKSVQEAEQAEARARRALDQSRLPTPGGPRTGGVGGRNVRAEFQAQAERQYAQAVRARIQAEAQGAVSTLSRDRLMERSTQITAKQAEGVNEFVKALGKLPKEQRTRLLLEADASAMSRVGMLLKTGSKGVKVAVRAVLESDQPVRVKLAALNALARNMSPATVKAIVEGDQPARVKIAALSALAKGVPSARVRAIVEGDGTAREKLVALGVAVGNVPKSIPISVSVAASQAFGEINALVSRLRNLRATGRATGRGPTSGEPLSLVGEGRHAREAIVSPAGGWSMIVDRPMVLPLGSDAYVIPEDPMQRGRSMGLLAALAEDLGLRGFAKGKGKKKDPDRRSGPTLSKKQQQWVDRPLPQTVDPTRLPLEELNDRAQVAERQAEQWSTRRDERKRQLAEARRKKKGVKQADTNYQQAKKSAADAQAYAKQQRKLADQAQRYQDQITIATNLANEAGTMMGTANAAHDAAGYERAKKLRMARLGKLRGLVQAAFDALRVKGGVAGTGLLADLASLDGEIQTAADSTFDVEEQTGAYTSDEQRQLDLLDQAVALATLTDDGNRDDLQAVKGRESYLSQVLASAQAAGRPASAITQIATDLKQARDAAVSLAQDRTPDMQAQLDQANRRADLEATNARLNAQILSAFASPGDMGGGGRNAFGAATVVTQNFNMLHPGDPRTQQQIASVAIGGASFQGGITSPRIGVV